MIGDCRARDPAGRAALIDAYDLSVPVTRVLSAIGAKRRIIEHVSTSMRRAMHRTRHLKAISPSRLRTKDKTSQS